MKDINSTISNNLKELMDSKKINNKELSKKLGVSESTVGKWLLKKSTPRMGVIEKISEIFNVNKSDILEEKIELEKIKGITLFNRARQIPIVGTIACGTPIFADENLEGYFIADSSIRADFALKCKGDSMIDAEIYDGDTVFLKKTPDVENGKIAAVLIDNEATLKKVIKTNDVIILQPCNSNSNLYKPILLDGKEDTMILGEMVGVYHPYKK